LCSSKYTAFLEEEYKFGSQFETPIELPLLDLTDITRLYEEIDPREPLLIGVNVENKQKYADFLSKPS